MFKHIEQNLKDGNQKTNPFLQCLNFTRRILMYYKKNMLKYYYIVN